MMSHAAIVCREYALPAVTGTGNATTTITDGQLLRVDGDTGKVTVLDGEGAAPQVAGPGAHSHDHATEPAHV